MKKFYTLASVREAGDGFTVTLDGKPVRTQGEAFLNAPTRPLAEAVAGEWARQGETIIPHSMPLTQILSTTLDQVMRDREAMTRQLGGWIDTDLLCYRADGSVRMAERQAEAWDRWLGWFEEQYGVALRTTTGLCALTQPDEARAAVAQEIAAMDDFHFCILQMVTALTGSVILALALSTGAGAPDEIYEAALAEEILKGVIHDEARYGAAPHEEQTRAALKRDLHAARIFLDLLEI